MEENIVYTTKFEVKYKERVVHATVKWFWCLSSDKTYDVVYMLDCMSNIWKTEPCAWQKIIPGDDGVILESIHDFLEDSKNSNIEREVFIDLDAEVSE